VTDLGPDPGALRAYAQGLEDIGYDEVFISEHIVGVDLKAHQGWTPFNPSTPSATGPLYDYTFPFFEPLVTFGFLAGVTTRLRMGSSVMVLGMRQAVLVAKQAAIADVLSGGRITLGVGSGWNDLEYKAMGVDFRTRGSRIEEQIRVMRELWCNEVVNFAGDWHTIPAAGINPLPVQRPIPIWIGGDSEKATTRAARVGDGWYPGALLEPAASGQPYRLSADGAAKLAQFREAAARSGRDPATLDLVGAVNVGPRDAVAVADELEGWALLGATHVNVRTSRYPPTWWTPDATSDRARTGVDQHLQSLQTIMSVWRTRSAATPA
jgi:probable F420-dependent oxidoreductase